MIFKKFCSHKRIRCVTNLYGDIRNDFNCCSIWECEKCGKVFLSDNICEDCKVVNFKQFAKESLKNDN